MDGFGQHYTQYIISSSNVMLIISISGESKKKYL